ncbi:hypothetical protein BJ997_001643 [Cryobacterium roopkundense]|uniref:Uncharacterized protein n=1 Tax=Cryobacterium roopkundense TaxID=1001240 RepID=A0A7W9E4M6_9MICO|nr:hypothetical protein [Cryobacterium roopkundense]
MATLGYPTAEHANPEGAHAVRLRLDNTRNAPTQSFRTLDSNPAKIARYGSLPTCDHPRAHLRRSPTRPDRPVSRSRVYKPCWCSSSGIRSLKGKNPRAA